MMRRNFLPMEVVCKALNNRYITRVNGWRGRCARWCAWCGAVGVAYSVTYMAASTTAHRIPFFEPLHPRSVQPFACVVRAVSRQYQRDQVRMSSGCERS
jgi:hypothetical protein